ncbi:MAG TPA: phosphopentomutase [bacterium]|nr:phosphopentomutase [bacterium]
MANKINRVILIVMDSVGCGAMEDAGKYNDAGTNTLGNIAEKRGGLNMPNFHKLGLGNIIDIKGVPKTKTAEGCFGKCREASVNKDTTTGHWEMAGLKISTSFPAYPNGFPEDIIKPFEKFTGKKVLCNAPASGTEILEKLGDEHCKTGNIIVYTSADSVFQIAAHEEVIPLKKLYEICEYTRKKILIGKHAVGRVIARPFLGTSGNYKRTTNRRDFSVLPFGKTMLDIIKENGMDVAAVGKIEDIFANQGITKAVHTVSNMDGTDKTLDYMKEKSRGIIFTNLVDFDMLWGHRRNAEEYAAGLEEFDSRLPELINGMNDDDMIMFTADHGCDPTHTIHTDHTREYVPLVVYGKALKANVNLGVRATFSDISATILDFLGLKSTGNGTSFKKDIEY